MRRPSRRRNRPPRQRAEAGNVTMQLAAFAPLLPEIILAVAAMAVLMYGVFTPENEGNARTAGWLSVAVLIVAMFAVLWQPHSGAFFDGTFVVDSFARFMKVLMLAGAAATLILAFNEFSDYKALKFEYPALVLLATTGMMTMISAGDLITLYRGLE